MLLNQENILVTSFHFHLHLSWSCACVPTFQTVLWTSFNVRGSKRHIRILFFGAVQYSERQMVQMFLGTWYHLYAYIGISNQIFLWYLLIGLWMLTTFFVLTLHINCSVYHFRQYSCIFYLLASHHLLFYYRIFLRWSLNGFSLFAILSLRGFTKGVLNRWGYCNTASTRGYDSPPLPKIACPQAMMISL